MSSSEYPHFYDFLKKITTITSLTREDLKLLVQGQTIFLVMDGTYSHRPTLFEFVYMSQHIDENDAYQSVILKVMKPDLSSTVEINTADFSVERRQDDRPVTLRRLFADVKEARNYFENVCYVYDVHNEAKINSSTYFFIYTPNKKLGDPDGPKESGNI